MRIRHNVVTEVMSEGNFTVVRGGVARSDRAPCMAHARAALVCVSAFSTSRKVARWGGIHGGSDSDENANAPPLSQSPVCQPVRASREKSKLAAEMN
jgi:hypothetical protein